MLVNILDVSKNMRTFISGQTEKVIFQKIARDWVNGSIVKKTFYLARELKFTSQHLRASDLQPCIISTPWETEAGRSLSLKPS